MGKSGGGNGRHCLEMFKISRLVIGGVQGLCRTSGLLPRRPVADAQALNPDEAIMTTGRARPLP